MPPFLVVHTNAAYSRLTGIDSHIVVGKPISSLLSIQDGGALSSARGNDEGQVAATDGDNNSSVNSPSRNTQSSDLAAAAAAGRARAEVSSRHVSRDVGLERLVASSGFGHLLAVQVTTKPHQMVGRNLTILQGATTGRAALNNRDEGSNATSLTSSCAGGASVRLLGCRASIAPVVSSSEAVGGTMVTDKESDGQQKSKRRKHHNGADQDAHRRTAATNTPPHNRRHNHRQVVTHYVIQLENDEGTAHKQGSAGSLSSDSTSVEARLLGLSKSQLHRQRAVASLQSLTAAAAPDGAQLPADEEGGASESTEPKESLTAIG